MTGIEAFLRDVDANLVGMDRAVREDIVRELRSHLADAVAAEGSGPATAIRDLGSPREVGRRYKDVYGYGRPFRALFTVVALLLAVPTLPVLGAFAADTQVPDLYAVPAVAVLAAFLIWVSVRAGSQAGLYAGLAAAGGRLGLLFLLAVLGSSSVIATPDGLAAFAAVSTILVVLGWLPGEARKRWKPSGAEL